MSRADWEDERLAAALRARFDRPAPRDLAGAIHAAIGTTSPARGGWFRPVSAWATLAAAVVLVAVGGAAVLGLGGLGRPGSGSTGPSDSARASTAPSASVGVTATPIEQALPGNVFGLPIVHVRDAVAVRDADAANTEMALQGWFTPASPDSCGPPPTAPLLSPLQRECPGRTVWLTEDAESLVHVNGDTLTISSPVGPAVNPFLDGLDTSWVPALPQVGTDGGSTPADVVLIGHFGDRRADRCAATEQAACRTWFVVDSVAYVHGQPIPINPLHLTGRPPVSSVADIEAVIANEAPQSPILSMAIVDGPGLAQMEPTLSSLQAGLDRQPVLWVARVLEGEFISTYIVIDGTNVIYEMNPNNEAIMVGGPVPQSGSSASPGHWPPAGARIVTLSSQVAAGASPVQVAVVDRSGRLVGVAEKGSVEPSYPSVGVADPGGYSEPGKPGRVHLAWTGSICDNRITVTVAADLKTIAFDMGPQPLCDSLGVERQVVLDFSGSVDVGTIEVFRNP